MLARIKFEIGGLVREIIERLPAEVFTSTETTFLDPAMAGGQFLVEIIRKLRDNGHSDDNIASRVFGLAEDRLDLNYAQRKNGVIGQLAVGGIETLENYKNMGKKFDVVIGNPPYQDVTSTNTKNLWPKFVELAKKLAVDGGHFALITPRTWATNAMYDEVFLKLQPTHINLDECARHFPSVSSTFSYFIVQNTDNDGRLVEITLADGTDNLRLPTRGLGAKSIKALSVISKIDTGVYMEPFTSYKYHTDRFTKNDAGVSKDKTHQHYVEVLHKLAADGSKTVFYADTTDPKQNGVWRVVHSLWVGRWADMFVSDTTHACQQFIQYATSSKIEAMHLQSVLTSKLYTFIMLQSVSGGSLTMKSVSKFPKVDLTRSWTDAELYAHFKLTQDEIDLIEATVK